MSEELTSEQYQQKIAELEKQLQEVISESITKAFERLK